VCVLCEISYFAVENSDKISFLTHAKRIFLPPSHDAEQAGGKGISFVIKLVASGAPIATKESLFLYLETEKKTRG
jgi:hypothetical protein